MVSFPSQNTQRKDNGHKLVPAAISGRHICAPFVRAACFHMYIHVWFRCHTKTRKDNRRKQWRMDMNAKDEDSNHPQGRNEQM